MGGAGALRGVLGGSPVVSVSNTRTSIVVGWGDWENVFGEKI